MPIPSRPTAEVAAAWSYAESWLGEDDVLATAREHGAEVGATPVGPGGGAALRMLAAAVDARAVVEIGTGCGVSGIWLLRGMRPAGVLTSIDVEAEHQRLAREAYAAAGYPAARTRLIAGRALDVLPRLADAAYDLVFADGDKTEYPDYVTEGVRLLRPGGVLVLDNALWSGRVADPAARDPATVAIREAGRVVREHPALVPALLPVGDGLLTAVRRDDRDPS